MNKSQLVLAAIPAALAMAAPNLALGAKSDIHHCGCADDGASLVCKQLNVNDNSLTNKHPQGKTRGHNGHTINSWVTCVVEDVIIGSYQRSKEDCGHADLPGGLCDDEADECTVAEATSNANCTVVP